MHLVTLYNRQAIKIDDELAAKIMKAKIAKMDGTVSINGGVYDLKAISHIEPMKPEKPIELPPPPIKPVSKEMLAAVRKEISKKYNLTPQK